ncbi:MAG TPA: glycosyltransferase family 4 protein [Pyrinomonadaceae bacterium]|jgi:glycosyltransferase involved in cell wall biosynthesis
MRIAVLYWSKRKIGGTEEYLESIISELHNAGHQLAFWHEVEGPDESDPIKLPDGVPAWCVDELGAAFALDALRNWLPDVLFTHCLMDLRLEAETFKIAPAIFFAHAYYGTCISGNKAFSRPVPRPCHRRFGWQCLVNYYPHGCGGSSPFTMVKEYRRQSKRLEQLQNYRAIMTHSAHMRDEYVKHGFDPARVHCLSYFTDPESNFRNKRSQQEAFSGLSMPSSGVPTTRSGSSHTFEHAESWRILFLARMERLKGGQLLIDALPYVCDALNQGLQVTFAGDGRMRKTWERRAARIQSRTPGLHIQFTGWVTGNERESVWDDCDLLVVPSVWPEPFGLVGPEAGLRGIPIVGFAVGGIPEWLIDGENGCLAPGEPPTSKGLAEAILRCLRDPTTHARMQRSAIAMAQHFSVRNHLGGLIQTFEQALTF